MPKGEGVEREGEREDNTLFHKDKDLITERERTQTNTITFETVTKFIDLNVGGPRL